METRMLILGFFVSIMSLIYCSEMTKRYAESIDTKLSKIVNYYELKE